MRPPRTTPAGVLGCVLWLGLVAAALSATSTHRTEKPKPASVTGSVPRTIALKDRSKNVLCLDIPGALGQDPLVQLWQCNGHTNQLWRFDDGSWTIRYAADPSKCLDAGDPGQGGSTPGSLLMIWDCNGLPQQQWGYDADLGTIYLKGSRRRLSLNPEGNASLGDAFELAGELGVGSEVGLAANYGSFHPDASLCVDAFSPMAMGNNIQLWTCNLLAQQLWDINWGTTIRVGEHFETCIDLIEPAQDGALVQAWECNGHINQQWIWDPGSGRIVYGGNGGNPPLCLDAHDFTSGNRLMVWSCNGGQQQDWGYDTSMLTIYLSSSVLEPQSTPDGNMSSLSPLLHPMASLCLDLFGGSWDDGNVIQSWNCNGCWNQHWLLAGGVSQTQTHLTADGRSDVWAGASRRAQPPPSNDCPPTPSPPSQPCAGGWPQFNDAASLAASPWGGYITDVYGDTAIQHFPYSFPFCIGDFWLLYWDKVQAHGITDTPKVQGTCPSGGDAVGDLYKTNNQFQPGNVYWIWHPGPFQAPKDDSWVEVTHMGNVGDEHHGAWFFYSRGSGIWYNVGKVIAFTDHGDAFAHFKTPSDNEKMAQAAAQAGIDTVVFLAHTDCEFKACNKLGGKLTYPNFEIMSTGLVGHYACCSANGDDDRLKAGWADKPCDCDNSMNTLNCDGVPIQPVTSGSC